MGIEHSDRKTNMLNIFEVEKQFDKWFENQRVLFENMHYPIKNAAWVAWLEAIKVYTSKKCHWSDDERNFYKTTCGKEFWYDKNFTDENSYSFCPYCGGSMTKTH